MKCPVCNYERYTSDKEIDIIGDEDFRYALIGIGASGTMTLNPDYIDIFICPKCKAVRCA